MNIVHAVTGITPAVIPASYLSVAIGWRNSFLALFVIALILSVAIFLFQPETLKKKQSKTLKKICFDYKSIFSNKLFVRYCSIKVLSVSLIFCVIF